MSRQAPSRRRGDRVQLADVRARVLAALAVAAAATARTTGAGHERPIVIGTANSLTGALAPFETAINDGMDVAVDGHQRRGRRRRPAARGHPRRREVGPQPVGDRRAGGDREGRRRRRPDLRRRLRRPGRTRREREGRARDHVRRRARHRPAGDRPAHVQHLHRRPDGERDQRRVRLPRRGAGARPTSSATSSPSTRRSSARRSRLAGPSSAARSSARTRSSRATSSIATQVTRLRNAAQPDVLLLAIVSGRYARAEGDPRRVRRADPARRRVLGDVLARGDAGPIEYLGAGGRLELRRRSARRGERVLRAASRSRPAPPRSSTRIRCSATPWSRRSRRASRSPGRPTASELAKALETFEGEPLLAGPTTYTDRLPRPRRQVAADHPVRGRRAALDRASSWSRRASRPIPAEQ